MKNSILTIQEIKGQLNIIDLVKHLGLEIFGGNKIRSLSNVDTIPSVQLNTKEGKLQNTFKDFSSGEFGDAIKLYKLIKEKKVGHIISLLDIRKDLTRIISELKTNNLFQSNDGSVIKQELAYQNNPSKNDSKENSKTTRSNILLLKNSQIYKYLLDQSDLAIKNLESRKYLTGENRKLTLSQLMNFNLHYISSPQKVKNSLTSKFSAKELESSGLFKNGNFIFDKKLIVIPFYEGGKITYLRARSIVGKKYLSLYNIEGMPYNNQRLFNSDILDTLKEGSILYASESEFDGMILNKMKKNFVSLSGLGTIPIERLKELNKRFRLRFAFDNDQPGLDALKNVAKKFGLPIKYLQINGYKDLSELPVESQKAIRNNPLLSVKYMIPSLNDQIINFDGSENFISASQLKNYKFGNIEWIIDDYLRSGIMEISGLPKVGKSRLMLYIAECIASGKKLFNKYETTKSKVLYISYEEQMDLFKERLEKMSHGNEISENILFPTTWLGDKDGEIYPFAFFNSLDDGGIKDIRNYFEKYDDLKIVIIDTYEKAFKGEKDNSKNEYRLTNARIKPLIDLAAEFKRLIIFIHHNNKMISNSIVLKSHGSVALTGAADIIWSLDSYGNNFETNKRKLSITGRLIKGREIILSFDDNGNWTEVDVDKENIIEMLTPEQKEVFNVFQKEPDRIFQFSEIAKLTNQSKQNATKKLNALVRENLILRLKTGKYKMKQNTSTK